MAHLPFPTDQLVKEEAERFDQENEPEEKVLGQLLNLFGANTQFAEVRLKVAGLNELYSAGVKRKHIETIARHLATTSNFDTLLQHGSPDAAQQIIDCKGADRYFSFASKYCSWHNPNAYPIYSSEVDACLMWYRQQNTSIHYDRNSYKG
jgi:hypothetical protein